MYRQQCAVHDTMLHWSAAKLPATAADADARSTPSAWVLNA